MSKKNSSVNLKKIFEDSKDLTNLFLTFAKKLIKLKKKEYLVAVSGGPDSLALVALTKAFNYSKKSKFHYVLVNHNLRKNSGREAILVKNLLKKHDINLKIFTNQKEIKKNIQAEARNVRYEILKNYCDKKKIQTLLTAHNLEDQVETFFIRLSRGSGLKGLSSMKPLTKISKTVSVYRPLLETRKQSLVKISKRVFGKYINDPSNKNSKFLRTKIRGLRKPLEKSGIKYEQIFKSINNLSQSKVTLDLYLNNIFRDLIKKKNKEVFVNFTKFKKLNKEIKMAVINESIKKIKNNYYEPRSKKVENLIKNLNKTNFKRSTLGGCIFFKKHNILCLKDENI